MVSINNASNTSNTTNTYSSKGFSGLASGLDTENMVKQMLANTQSKIDKQSALKQQTQWKQDTYRDIISTFHSFQNKFFNYLSPKTNLLSASFYSTKSVSSSSSAVKVSALGDILNNSLTIDSVSQLATATRETGLNPVSTSPILSVDLAAFEGAEAPSVNVTLDGITKTINLRQDDSAKKVLENLQADLTKAFGNGIGINTDTGAITVASDRHVTFSSSNAGQKILGFTGSVSNKISLTKTLGDLNLKETLTGNSFEFSINGTEFKFDKSNTLNDIIRQVNSSSAGVKMSYSSLTDKFSFEATTLGKDITIDMKQTKGNLLTSIFGTVGTGSAVTSTSLRSNSIKASEDYSIVDVTSGTFTFSVDGKNHAIQLEEPVEGETGDIITRLNQKLADTFEDGSVQLVVDGSKVKLTTSNSSVVKIDASSPDGLAAKLGFTTGAENIITSDTLLSDIGAFDKITVGGVNLVSDGVTTVQQLVDFYADGTQGFTVSFENGVFGINDTTPGSELLISGDDDGKALLKQMFGSKEIKLSTPNIANDAANIKAGQNAILSVNGQPIERNTNDFNIDGYQIALQSESTTAITLSSENNTEQMFDGIVQFVNEYNGLIEKINELTTAKATYKDYAPLTEEQKKEMSEKEIELWEEKAKEGLLSGDSVLNSIASSLRSLMYTQPENSNLALYNIGITTSSNYMDKGKLLIDEDKLKASINQDPAAINLLFTDKKGGIAVELNKLIDSAAKSSVASPGRLVTLAGVKNTATDKKNSLFDRMSDIDKTITRLKGRYEMEKSRYWKQFASLEKVINQTNSQSSWLMNMFGQ